MGLCIFAESAGAPGKPTKIARFRNIPPTAVQHDETPARGGRFCRPRPLHERPAPVLHKPSLLSARRTPVMCRAPPRIKLRSEERRVGKECRSRRAPDQNRKTEMHIA